MVNLSSFLGAAAGGATVTILIRAVDEYSKSFNKATGDLSKFKIAATAFGAAGVTALTAFGVASVKAAIAMQPIEFGFKRLAQNSDDFLRELKVATDGTISNFDLMRQSNNALLLGLQQNSLPEFFKNAGIVGAAMGRSATDAIQDITLGIGRQSKLILDNLGIIVKAEEAYEKYAQVLGKNVNRLTESEKQTAFTNAAMKALNDRAKQLGGTLDDNLNKKVQQLNASFEDLKNNVGNALIPTLTFLGQITIDGLNDQLNRVKERTNAVGETLLFLNKVIFDGVGISQAWNETSKSTIDKLKDEVNGVNELIAALQKKNQLKEQERGIDTDALFTSVGLTGGKESGLQAQAFFEKMGGIVQEGARFEPARPRPPISGGSALRPRISRSFQVGGLVPKTGIALLHQGERVLPRSETNSSSTNTVNIHLNGPIFGDKHEIVRELSEAFAQELKMRVAAS